MSQITCVHCNAVLNEPELLDGWCEACGKKIPQHLVSAAVSRNAKSVPPNGESIAPKPRRRASLLAIPVIVGCLLVASVGCGYVFMRISDDFYNFGAFVKGGVVGLAFGGIVGVGVSRALGLLGQSADED